MEYIIIQAGGKGSRLGYLTKNKPKALVPVDNLPMIFYLFRKYPGKRFIIIADYHREVLRNYLDSFASVDYLIVEADGEGTCGGVRQAIDYIPKGEPFMLIWSDLILADSFNLPEEYGVEKKPTNNYVGLSGDFPCRWKYEDHKFEEERSVKFGVAGLFLFKEKSVIDDIPGSGEFVRWISEKKIDFETVDLSGTREFGLLEEYEKLGIQKCRPFNRIRIDGDILIKEPVDDQGEKLSIRERMWYKKAKELKVSILPEIKAFRPLSMEYIRGKNIYDCSLSFEKRKNLLYKLVNELKRLHESSTAPTDYFSMKEAYYRKTIDRLSRIENLIPYAREPYITVNGRRCKNVFFYQYELEKALDKLRCENFSFIHGDCTFSNMMVRENGDPVLIDPRGYFGFTELYGDVRYDWAKLYYSVVGNYDQFNLKRFSLEIGGKNGTLDTSLSEGEVLLSIQSNSWEDMEKEFFLQTGTDEWEIKLIHAVIWLSLTTYAWQDYDSVCGAFYNGLWYLEEVL